MKIERASDNFIKKYFKVTLETREDCEFLDYIERAEMISVGGTGNTEIGRTYNVTVLHAINPLQNILHRQFEVDEK